MFLKLIRDLARPRVFAVLDALKRSSGLTAGELCRKLKMSPTGVKQHCASLVRKGLVDTWRRSGTGGRPEKIYRLTVKTAHLYPEAGADLTLEILQAVQQTWGTQAPDKLIFQCFSKRADVYAKKVKGRSIAERAGSLARMRDAEGHCAGVEFDAVEGLRIVEYHMPLKEIAAAWPSVKRMEEQMFSRILNTQVTRTEQRISGLTRVVFAIPTVASNAPITGMTGELF